MDVIAKCAFGMKIEGLGQTDNVFMEKAKRVFSPPTNSSPSILLPCKYITLLRYFLNSMNCSAVQPNLTSGKSNDEFNSFDLLFQLPNSMAMKNDLHQITILPYYIFFSCAPQFRCKMAIS